MRFFHPMRGCPVRLRMALWNVGVLALVLTAFGAAIRYADEVKLTAGLDGALERRADGLLMGPFDRHGPEPPPEFGPHGGGHFPMPGGLEFPWREFGSPGPRRHFHRGPRHWPAPAPDGMAAWRDREPAPEGRRPEPWGGAGEPLPPPPQIEYRFLTLTGKPFTGAGRFPAAPAAGPWDRTALARAARGQAVSSTATAAGQPMRILTLPVEEDGKRVGMLQLATPLVGVYAELGRLSGTLLTLFPLALLAAALGGAFLTEHALRPVRQITHAAARIGASDLGERLPVVGKDEFSELAGTFNGMLARLEGAFTQLALSLEQQRRFTSDASHELRTPLTVIKANTSLALEEERSNAEYRRALEAADRATDLMGRIVQDLLLLARGDAGQLRLEHVPIRVNELLEWAAEPFRQTGAPPISIALADPTLAVFGDKHHLVRLFSNLLENGVRHTEPSGAITLTAAREGSDVQVQVRDMGEGIPPEHLPHVCERFYRIDAARARRHGGTGLGLAICQSIVEAHDGSLAIVSTVGQGTIVTVRLPGGAVSADETAASRSLETGAVGAASARAAVAQSGSVS